VNVFPPLAVVVAMAVPAAYPLAVSSARAPRAGAFMLAVVRRDGMLIPFAGFDGKRWGRSWPTPELDLQVPINLTSVPKRWWGPMPPLSNWELETADGARTIQVTQPDWVDVHCQRQVALRTDYVSDLPAPPPRVQPYPKDGLAVSPPHAVQPIDVIAPGRASTYLSGLREAFNDSELEIDRNLGHPMSRRSREAIEPSVEALYAFGEHPRVYYVEASRMYRRMGDTGCTAIAFGTGWFTRDGNQFKWLDMAVDLLGCNKYGATYMLPLGAVVLDGRRFWIAQYAGWDHERYVVVEVKAKSVEAVVSAWGGGC
jgi:hypothetical protein